MTDIEIHKKTFLPILNLIMKIINPHKFHPDRDLYIKTRCKIKGTDEYFYKSNVLHKYRNCEYCNEEGKYYSVDDNMTLVYKNGYCCTFYICRTCDNGVVKNIYCLPYDMMMDTIKEAKKWNFNKNDIMIMDFSKKKGKGITIGNYTSKISKCPALK